MPGPFPILIRKFIIKQIIVYGSFPENDGDEIEMEKERLWNLQYITLMIANIFSYFGFFIVSTMLSPYLTGDGVGLSDEAAGVIVGMFAITGVTIPFEKDSVLDTQV